MASLKSDSLKLHEAIENGELEEVEGLLRTIVPDKHYYDEDEKSAAFVALEREEDVIYELLVSKGISIGPHERLDEIPTIWLSRSIHMIHKKYFKDLSLKHLSALNSFSKASHEASSSERRQQLWLITEAFEDLNSSSWIEPILKIASTIPNLQIVFDFNHSSVEFLDPTKQRYVTATSSVSESYIYIGAKDLRTDRSFGEARCQVLSSLIHELCHIVLNVIYQNNGKPYKKGDEEMMEHFLKVVDMTEARKDVDPILESVYEYHPESRNAELIACVPQLLALYKDNEAKFEQTSAQFSELFMFYKEKTLVDLVREYPLLMVKQEIRKVNELCGSFALLDSSAIETTPQALDSLDIISSSMDEFLFLSSNSPQITLRAIYHQQSRLDQSLESSRIFADLRFIKVGKIFESVVRALRLSTNPILIVDCANNCEVSRLVRKFHNYGIRKNVVFVADCGFDSSVGGSLKTVVHSSDHLTEDSQKLPENKFILRGLGTRVKGEPLMENLHDSK